MTAVPSATILGCEGPVLSADEVAFFRDANPLGFILFARNVDSPDQLRRLTGDLRAALGRDAMILVDQEGGRVQRLRAPHWREWLPPLDQVAALRDPAAMARSIWLRYRLIAAELRAVGIDADCAPSGDVARPETHPFLRNRCFGSDVATVIRAARACAEGLLAGGVLPVMKHLPGHGLASLDSHHELPRADVAAAVLEAVDFAPFRALSSLPMAMTAHIVFPAFDTRPATASARMIGIIRDRIGFHGLLLSDDISMQALSGAIALRTRAAIGAGCDVVLHCNGRRPEMEQAVTAAGPLSDPALVRAHAALARRIAPEPVDTARLEAEFAALVPQPTHG